MNLVRTSHEDWNTRVKPVARALGSCVAKDFIEEMGADVTTDQRVISVTASLSAQKPPLDIELSLAFYEGVRTQLVDEHSNEEFLVARRYKVRGVVHV